MSHLFEPLELRDVRLRNRVMVSPMCQYSATDGMPEDWHLVHLGGLARGGAGLVMAEATAVLPEGRISPRDTGLWDEDQAQAWTAIAGFVRSQGAAAGIQLAHAGHKAGTWWPWAGGQGSVPPAEGGWATVGPSDTGYPGLAAPRALATDELAGIVAAFAAAARRAATAGFDVVEVHAAHGYLLHQFLSPISNDRTDRYGGDLLGRSRLLQEVVAAVRAAWPAERPLLVRISATDWVEGGLTIEDTVTVAGWLRDLGMDLLDVSSAGISPDQRIPVAPGYQVPLARRIRHEAGVRTAAVGLVTQPAHAAAIVAEGSADLVALARVLLRDPQWPLRAAHELGVEVEWPPQLRRGHW
jgi:2,4-dienoyl-CoA reductase-like NADH-dependent reductase (Old Yellow Enzyme family)